MESLSFFKLVLGHQIDLPGDRWRLKLDKSRVQDQFVGQQSVPLVLHLGNVFFEPILVEFQAVGVNVVTQAVVPREPEHRAALVDVGRVAVQLELLDGGPQYPVFQLHRPQAVEQREPDVDVDVPDASSGESVLQMPTQGRLRPQALWQVADQQGSIMATALRHALPALHGKHLDGDHEQDDDGATEEDVDPEQVGSRRQVFHRGRLERRRVVVDAEPVVDGQSGAQANEANQELRRQKVALKNDVLHGIFRRFVGQELGVQNQPHLEPPQSSPIVDTVADMRHQELGNVFVAASPLQVAAASFARHVAPLDNVFERLEQSDLASARVPNDQEQNDEHETSQGIDDESVEDAVVAVVRGDVEYFVVVALSVSFNDETFADVNDAHCIMGHLFFFSKNNLPSRLAISRKKK